MVYFILIAYLAVTFLSSLVGAGQQEETPESYFLANRNVATVTLFFTLIATNFSAFFFLGFAGEAYRIGYSYYAMMAFGTAFAALSFYLIGNKAWKLGKEKGYLTPVEMVGDMSKSNILKYTFLIVMFLFTFPYIAIQPIGAGIILENLTEGAIPFHWGATLLTIFIILYVFIGGMRSVAHTDVKQGILMIGLMLGAFFVITQNLGGLTTANQKVFELKPELFYHEGVGGHFTWQKWMSFTFLWMATVPMFPQLFMRFFIARSLPHFKTSTVLYAAIPSFLFLLPVVIGVLGHLEFPNLVAKEPDKILPMMLSLHAPEWLAALVMTGALAAFMSTLDSQLLALSTITTRDILVANSNREIPLKRQVFWGRIFVIGFALIGLGIAFLEFKSIFEIIKLAFTGLGILFPAVLIIFYTKKYNANILALSILLAELFALLVHFSYLPKSWIFGFEPIIPAMLIVLIMGGLSTFISTSKAD